jgi:hypothetical protein
VSRTAGCPYCGKPEGEECPACGGVNARDGADKKRRAGSDRRAAGEECPPNSMTQSTATGKPAPRGGVRAGQE